MRFSMIVCLMYLCVLPCTGRNLAEPALRLDGAKIETLYAAKRNAFDAYIRHMEGRISATDSVQEVRIISLCSDVPDFAQSGTLIWEAHIMDNGVLRAVVWVHPDSDATCFPQVGAVINLR